ncbi:MAG: undecaprenyl-diphosphate phosphatase [Bacillota bacterium]|jgi:undecaprenyl-diphosphatase|nr:undecaprenyl-diphosphate phosphatase [Bacillota bacterium]MDI9415389.1 undecaprenyl-diphosphate phosphatase [Bacillota bacterium]HCD41806.1 undecaprenyl-diphosphatase [Bacillota bacterium]HOB88126.1 undecaprenyl-diphosphate phosphatase [Bacillota bacterium]HOJ57625.1 undecaprenyl-diphosphate phosphatase [Bacillota bacterium]
MDIKSALALAVVQGLTEFLPVSSSGHLVIVRELLHVEEALISFDVLVHLGTLVSVLLVFREDVKALISAALDMIGDVVHGTSMKDAVSKSFYRKVAVYIVVGSVPAAIMGFLARPLVYMLFSSKLAVGIFLIATGTVLRLGEIVSKNRAEPAELTLWRALAIGIAQGFAIVPGFSRSGATISTGLFVGLGKEDAARFSFLLSIPVVLGAGLLELKEIGALGFASGSGFAVLSAFAASVISGYLAINLVLKAVKAGKLTVFSIYTWVLGISVIIWSLI